MNIVYRAGRYFVFRNPLSVAAGPFRRMADAVGFLTNNAPLTTERKHMSAKSVFETIFGFALLAGEQLATIVVHNPRSQQFVTILTPDVNALFQLLESQGAMAPAATVTPAA